MGASVGSSSRWETVLLVSDSINNLPRFVKHRDSPLIRDFRLERLTRWVMVGTNLISIPFHVSSTD